MTQTKLATREIATKQARAHFKKDVAFRLWASQHGRIYVPIGDHFSPDPYLAHIPDRDITTNSGQKLSLINPARIIRQLDEQFGDYYGITGRITSLYPLRPENAPDEWERMALRQFEFGEQEVIELSTLDGESYLRLMQPVPVAEGCLLCHKDQGFVVGGLAGGVGVALPMAELLAQEGATLIDDGVSFFTIWVLGLLGINLSYGHLRRQAGEMQRAYRSLMTSEARKRAIMESALDCIVTIDTNGVIVEFNPTAEKTFGYTKERAIGHQMADLIIPESLRNMHRQGLERFLHTKEAQILGTRFETSAIRADGSEFPVELTISKVDLDGEILFTAFLRDITEASLLTEQLNFQANHDGLTGLFNRRTFEERLDQTVHSMEKSSNHCLLYMDLDQFKVINDSCGHAAGDELLRQVSRVLKEQVRTTDMLARLGGDEFGLFLERCSVSKAKEISTKLLEAVQAYRFCWQDKIFRIGASIGLVPVSGFGVRLSELLSFADTACYKAKEEGRNRYHLYNPNDQELAKRRGEMGWVSHIEAAFEEGRFRLYQQSIHPLRPGLQDDKYRFEILLRMIDSNGELVGPYQFIPAAERYNLMPTIDRWVIRTALRWINDHKNLRESIAMCNINLSGVSLSDPLFGNFVIEQLQIQQIPPELICFEITETAAITNLAKATYFMESLKKTGCQFALDDFGSGMSSFGYLKNLPVDYLKIDGDFVRDMMSDNISHAMIRSINEIGQVMGKKTIAEFVETAEIMTELQNIGVDFAQGYAIDIPSPLETIRPVGLAQIG